MLTIVDQKIYTYAHKITLKMHSADLKTALQE